MRWSMKSASLFAAGLLAVVSLASHGLADFSSPADPDYPYWPSAKLTPGATQSTSAAQFCQSGWSSAHRNVTSSQYGQVYGSYGIPYPQPTRTFELDHLIPLELGGANSNTNLWPQPGTTDNGWGYHDKDQLENTMHSLVCAGKLNTATAQHAIATDWINAYCTYIGGCK